MTKDNVEPVAKDNSNYRFDPPEAEPTQRQWVGLTDEQIDKLFGDGPYVPAMLLRDVARAVEAKLKEKNT